MARSRRGTSAEAALIGLMLAVVQALVVGTAAVRWLDPAMHPRRMLGAAYLVGSGICAFILLALSVAGIPWTSLSFTAAFCLVAIALWVPLLRSDPPVRSRPPAPEGGAALAIDACTLVLVVAHGAYALKASGREWDFWAIWGLKARVFFVHGGIDWTYLAHPDHAFAHPDYPPLLPLDFVHVALLQGEWPEGALGMLSTLFAAALLLMVRDFFAEEFRRPAIAAAATLAVASGAFSKSGLADAPMIAFGTAGLLMIRRESYRTGAVLLGLAAFTKNEGLALMIGAAVALLTTSRRREVLRLWPAAAIAAPWLLLRAVHALPTYLAAGDFATRVTTAVARLPELARALADHPPNAPLFWIAIAVALIASAHRLDQERFLLVVIVLQLSFYLGAYLVTPHQLHAHVGSSWPRILQHMAVPAAFAALALVTDAMLRRDPVDRA